MKITLNELKCFSIGNKLTPSIQLNHKKEKLEQNQEQEQDFQKRNSEVYEQIKTGEQDPYKGLNFDDSFNEINTGYQFIKILQDKQVEVSFKEKLSPWKQGERDIRVSTQQNVVARNQSSNVNQRKTIYTQFISNCYYFISRLRPYTSLNKYQSTKFNIEQKNLESQANNESIQKKSIQCQTPFFDLKEFEPIQFSLNNNFFSCSQHNREERRPISKLNNFCSSKDYFEKLKKKMIQQQSVVTKIENEVSQAAPSFYNYRLKIKRNKSQNIMRKVYNITDIRKEEKLKQPLHNNLEKEIMFNMQHEKFNPLLQTISQISKKSNLNKSKIYQSSYFQKHTFQRVIVKNSQILKMYRNQNLG